MSSRPNIIIVTVDELRFPMNFPAGTMTSDEFMKNYMPYTYNFLWKDGIKFFNHQAAGCDCTPGRSTMVTGLYTHQTFMFLTRGIKNLNAPSPQAALDPRFPTYGKFLRKLQYETPYVGKWHLSNSSFDSNAPLNYLEDYGFDALTTPDPVGGPGEGLGGVPPSHQHGSVTPNDSLIAAQAIGWLRNYVTQQSADDGQDSGQGKGHAERAGEFCLSVNFVNPHDKQFFWAGIEADRYNALFEGTGLTPAIAYGVNIVQQVTPPDFDYDLPANWESTKELAAKPKLQRYFRAWSDVIWGGISDDKTETGFKVVKSSGDGPYGQDDQGAAIGPFEYWIKAQNVYTQTILEVDRQIGQFLGNIPSDVLANSVVIFTSDHGEYSSAHGLQGKGGGVYKESVHVPLIVRDFTGRYAAAPEIPRTQLTSSIDLVPFYLSLASGGMDWLEDTTLEALYGSRANLFGILSDPAAPGRGYALHTTDELYANLDDYWLAPEHVVGIVTETGKLGTYSFWKRNDVTPQPEGMEYEYYSYLTERGKLELDSHPDSPEAEVLKKLLLDKLVPDELQKPLPLEYAEAQHDARTSYWNYVERFQNARLEIPTWCYG
ncbi:sulfatase-like hydrolase/transferase [Skermanella aerolata]|nr:sulfatase-like hydrolase/transferase [Skermanella aerolata]